MPKIAFHICMYVVNFDALAQAIDIRIERRQVVFVCWMQDSNPRSQTPNRQQTDCPLTNRQSQVRKPTDSGVEWAECSLIIGTGCRVQVFSLILDSSVGLSLAIQSAGDLVSETLGSNQISLACTRASKLTTNMYQVCMYVQFSNYSCINNPNMLTPILYKSWINTCINNVWTTLV